MKYTTFRNSLLAGAVLAVAGGFIFMTKPAKVEKAVVAVAKNPPVAIPEPVTTPPPQPRGLVAPPEVAKPQAADAPGTSARSAKTPLRELDRELIQLYTKLQAAGPQSTKNTKNKDVFPGRPYKVNLYVEGDRVVRAKVDLNRNGKWDEKWSFEPAGDAPDIRRQVSPSDDDTTYPLTYKMAGGGWVQK